MSYHFYVSIEGAQQGKFKGDGGKSDRILAVGYEYDVAAPHDPATGHATGKRRHGPIVITKEFGPSSPQCFKALVTGETLKSVLIEFVHISGVGSEDAYFKVTLTNASIVEMRQSAGVAHPEGADWPHEADQISFNFQKISMEHVPSHIVAVDQLTV